MVQRRAFKTTGPGGNKFVNRGTSSSRGSGGAPIGKKGTPGKETKATKYFNFDGEKVDRDVYKKKSSGGQYDNTNNELTNSKKTKINRLRGGSLKARLANIRLANVFEPNYKPNPNVKSKPSDFGTKAQPPGADPVKVRAAPKKKRSNKYMKKNIFGAKKKDKGKDTYDDERQEKYDRRISSRSHENQS